MSNREIRRKRRQEKKEAVRNEKETERLYNGTLKEQYANLWFAFRFIYRTHPKLFFVRVPLMLSKTMEQIFPLLFVRTIINELTNERSVQTILLYSAIMSLSLFFIRAIRLRLSAWDAVELEKMNIQVQRKLAESVEKMPYSVMEHPDMQNYVWLAQNNRFQTILEQSTNMAGSILDMIGLSSVVASLTPVLLLFIIIFSTFKFCIDRYQRKLPRRYNQARTGIKREIQFYNRVMETIPYGKEVRVNTLEDWLSEKAHTSWKTRLFPLEKQFQKKLTSLQGLSGFVSLAQNLTLYVILSVEVLFAGMTVGDFTMYLAAANTFSNAVLRSSSSYSELMLQASFLKEYCECQKITESAQINDGHTSIGIPKSVKIEFRNVSFRYPGTDKTVLENINLIINQSESLSIVGVNGAGKTTFVKLLCRFYEPTEGKILINGIPSIDIPLQEYYNLLSVVFQKFRLFSFTAKENIAMNTVVDEHRFESCIQKAGLEKRIADLPKQADTYLYKEFDPDGIELSGGEGQKIAIARAVYHDAPIIVLDEPTSALDPIAEYNIYHSFHELSNGRTAVYISHRMSSTRFTDRTAVFANHTIAEYGTHDELMHIENGIYREMFSIQAGYYKT